MFFLCRRQKYCISETINQNVQQKKQRRYIIVRITYRYLTTSWLLYNELIMHPCMSTRVESYLQCQSAACTHLTEQEDQGPGVQLYSTSS